MKIYADLRCLQDENYAFRGIGYHSSVLLRNSRRYFAGNCELIGLIDEYLPDLPTTYRQLVDRTETVFTSDKSHGDGVFVQPSPMTSDPLKAARLVGQAGILSCAVVYDFIPLDISDCYLTTDDSVNSYAGQLSWLAAYDRYFPISTYSARRLRELLPVEQSSVHVTGVALRPAFEQMPRQPHVPQRMAELPDAFVLFVGGADPRKNLDVLLIAHGELYASHPDVHLVVVGNYASNHAEVIRETYRLHGGSDSNLHFRKDIADDQLSQMYRLAACTVCSSHIEGFSLPVIEAAACGSPLLASDNDAHRELIQNKDALFSANDARSLSIQLRRVLDEPAFAQELVFSQQEIAARFSEEAVCDRFWLPIAREMRQRCAGTSAVSSRGSLNRPRVSILAPYSPQESGVARYTHRTAQALGQLADVDIYTDCPAPVATPEVRNFFPLSDVPFISGAYDNTLAVIGNSHFHTKIIELQMKHGGPCLMHDTRLTEIYYWCKSPEYFRSLAERSLGRSVSLAESQSWIDNPDKVPSPFFDELIPDARPLIVHSRGIQDQCRRQYGVEAVRLPFCSNSDFPEADLQPAARREVRAALGIPSTQIAVMTFGIVGAAKLPETCIQAIAHMHQAGIDAHLYFVGSAGSIRKRLEDFAHICRVGGMIHFSNAWLSEKDYYRHLLAADFAIQLRNHFFGSLSAALSDCISTGITTVANDDLAEAIDSPPTVLRVSDRPMPEDVAAHLIKAYREDLHLDRLKPSRAQYVRDHSFETYAQRLLSVLTSEAVHSPLGGAGASRNVPVQITSDGASKCDSRRATNIEIESPTHKSALDQRMRVMASALNIDIFGTNLDSCVQFVERLQLLGLAREQEIFLLYQLFLARIPTRLEILLTSTAIDDSAESLCRRFTECDEFKAGRHAHIQFVTLPKTTLAVDVTSTLIHPLNTGIQRVVRSAATQLRNENLDHALIRFDPTLCAYRLLDEKASQAIYHWERRAGEFVSVAPNRNGRKVEKGVKRWLRRLFGNALTDGVSGRLKLWKSRLRPRQTVPALNQTGRSSSPPQFEQTLLLWNQPVLFPELMMDQPRLDAVSSLLQFTRLQSSLVLYDLIPLVHPDLVGGNVDTFVRFLTLLRWVSRVSCITQAVLNDLNQYLPLVGRKFSGPDAQAHLLGSDFDFHGVDGSTSSQSSTVPLVLSVGSLEFRKNHRRTLRAMIETQQQGCRFQGVFAGSPGWLSEDFVYEVERYKAAGFDVQVRQSVTDAELNHLYSNAAFTLFCSLAEGFGLPIVESVAKGVPCITSDRGSMREIAEKMGGCRLVDPESESDIARAIKELLHDREAYGRLRAEARQAKWTTWREYAHALYDFATDSSSSQLRRTLQAA